MKESNGDKFVLREATFESEAGWSKSLRADDTINGEGRTDLSDIRGLGSDVAVSV